MARVCWHQTFVLAPLSHTIIRLSTPAETLTSRPPSHAFTKTSPSEPTPVPRTTLPRPPPQPKTGNVSFGHQRASRRQCTPPQHQKGCRTGPRRGGHSRRRPVQNLLHLGVFRVAVLALREVGIQISDQGTRHLSWPPGAVLGALRKQAGHRPGDVLPPAFGVVLPAGAHLVLDRGLVRRTLVATMEGPGLEPVAHRGQLVSLSLLAELALHLEGL